MLIAMMVKKGDLQLAGKSINDSGTNTQASERARAAREGDFGDVLPSFTLGLKFFKNKGMELFGKIATRIPLINLIIELQDGGGGGGVEVEVHYLVFSSFKKAPDWRDQSF